MQTRVIWVVGTLLAVPVLGSGCSDSSDQGDVEMVPGVGTDGTSGVQGGAGAGAADPGGTAPGTDTAGGAQTPTAGDGSSSPTTEPAGGDDPAVTPPGGVPYAMDECGLNTGYLGDEQCILPPPPDQGFQLRIGPEDYDNPDPIYILEPGGEVTNDFQVVSGNTEDIYFYFRQYRLRPNSHHMIITTGSGFAGGRRIGTANLSQDNPSGGVIAPENEGVGIELAANSPINVSLHSINVTDQPVVREVWVNFWYRDPSVVTEPTTQLFEIGSASFQIQPGEDTILGPYTCDITGSGRMLWFYGHRHANNVRFSAWRVRNGVRDLFYEAYEWEEPLLLEYSSLVTNATPDRDNHVEGGWSGVLDVQPGDQLEWECHVINGRDTVLRFTNETYDGEMCIMDGELVGADCTGGGGPGGGFSFPGAGGN